MTSSGMVFLELALCQVEPLTLQISDSAQARCMTNELVKF